MAIFTGGSSGGGGGSTTSGGGVAARYLWNTGVGTGRPAAGNVKRRVSSTPNVMRLNYLDTAGANWRDEWLGSAIGQRLIFKSASTTNFAIIVVAAATADIVVAPPDESESNVEIQYTLESGSFATFGSADATTDGVLGWSNYEPCYVQRDSGSEANVTLSDLAALANFAYFDANFDLYDIAGNLIRSGTPTYAALSDLPSAAANSGRNVISTNPGNNNTSLVAIEPWALRSDGTLWKVHQGIGILAKALGSSPKIICPATTFNGAYTLSSAASGADTLITSADGGDAHGLTSAVAVTDNCYIYVSAGTNMVGFHKVTAIAVNTTGTTIQIDTAYNAANTITTIALAGTDIPVVAIQQPAWRSNTHAEILSEWQMLSTAATDARKSIIMIDNDSFSSYDAGGTANRYGWSNITRIFNKDSVSVQNSAGSLAGAGSPGNFGTGIPTGDTNTGNASTLTIYTNLAAANQWVQLVYFEERLSW